MIQTGSTMTVLRAHFVRRSNRKSPSGVRSGRAVGQGRRLAALPLLGLASLAPVNACPANVAQSPPSQRQPVPARHGESSTLPPADQPATAPHGRSQHSGHGRAAEADAGPALDWRAAEGGTLADQVQLTFPDRFVKAGESYFSPDGTKVIFQGVEAPLEGREPEDFYGMFVAEVRREGDRIVGLEGIRRISPPGSANTCGWFHPTDSDRVIFASTISSPTEQQVPGFQRGTGRYRWMFPPEMRIVQVDLRSADGSADSLKPLVPHAGAYMAECALTPDGRHLVYCSLESNQGDIFVKDLQSGHVQRVVGAPGYDGGPFFSPDGKRLCWRSDRLGDNLLQVFVADLRFDEQGSVIGIGPEIQVTRNGHVNWAPFWHPSGLFLVYATSQEGHRNYEVFQVDSDPGLPPERGGAESGPAPEGRGPARHGTGVRRVTFADGADVLPAFDRDGRWMIWTSQRGADASSQLWAARWLGPGVGR